MDYVGNQADLQDTFDVLHGAMRRQYEANARHKGSSKRTKKGKGGKVAKGQALLPPPPRVLAEQVSDGWHPFFTPL